VSVAILVVQCYCQLREPSFSRRTVLCSKEHHVIHLVSAVIIFRDVRNGFFKFTFGSVLRITTGSVRF